jgi:uncharacterized protein YybS (DUF2232 family)
MPVNQLSTIEIINWILFKLEKQYLLEFQKLGKALWNMNIYFVISEDFAEINNVILVVEKFWKEFNEIIETYLHEIIEIINNELKFYEINGNEKYFLSIILEKLVNKIWEKHKITIF